ncbi:hypothetical protein V3H56_02565 [Pseudomonas sp. MS646]|uniref:Uncharacterized protein n=1 Tax=Pseudomonas chlororaphis TaxID=587753 RepID=A0A0G3G8H1_9PSED|nr:hypothetical protein VM99_05455 [Pseudomonas chlororaphis]
MPTAQCLRSAVVVNGAFKIKSKKQKAKAKQGGLVAGLFLRLTLVPCGSGLAREGGFTVDLHLWEWSDLRADFSDELWRLPGGKGYR